METHLQTISNPNILSSQDISQIIRHFSYTIQQRIQEVQKNHNYFTCLNSNNYEKSQIQVEMLSKYNQYRTSNEHQIRLLQKFTLRIMQIFQFFRQKSQQPEILQKITQRIGEKLKQITRNQLDCQFFVNNRLKVQKVAIRPLMSRSGNSDMLSVVGPIFTKAQADFNAVFIGNKKTKTQMIDKRTVQVGKLFKYVFSLLKKGYLMKLKMEKCLKKSKNNKKNKDNQLQESSTISIQGTGAVLRTFSDKGKQNIQEHRLLSFGKQKLVQQNVEIGLQSSGGIKKQNCIFRKLKNRSISINQYSVLSSQNPSVLKQCSTKIRELEKRLIPLYQILDIEKYCMTRVAKDPYLWQKDQKKRNSLIQFEGRKYIQEYRKFLIKQKKQILTKEDQNTAKVQESEEAQKDTNIHQACQSKVEIMHEQKSLGGKLNTSNQSSVDKEGNWFQTLKNTGELQINFMAEILVDSHKTQQNECRSEFTSAQKQSQQNQQNTHTIIVCSSRFDEKQSNFLADNASNQMDKSENQFYFKSRSVKQSRKTLRKNLLGMLVQKSNILNQQQLNVQQINTSCKNQKPLRIPEKLQKCIQIDTNDLNQFVPLHPLRQKNSKNQNQNTKDQFSVKRKKLMLNLHPLNRCKVFREKKNDMKENMQMAMDDSYVDNEFDFKVISKKIKNSML